MRRGWMSVALILSLIVAGRVASGAPAVDVGGRLDEYLTRATPFGFSGALLVAKDGGVLINKGYGLAIRSEGVANTAETVFGTGSLTKQFTAAAIMKLEMMGKLSTDDPLSRYLEGVPADKAGITLHHLLTHTSGITGSTGPDYEEVGRDEAVARALAEPLAFEPGEAMSYSNAGYSVLAAVVERVSGLPYEEFLREYLFEPAGMASTGYRLPDWSARTIARWYRGNTDNGTPLERPYPYWNLIGNGGILSTTGDMYAWTRALRGDRILNAEAKEKLFTPFLNDYAYGWDTIETEHGTLVQHDGGSDLGNSAELRWFVDEDLVIMLFCNESYAQVPLFELVRDEIETLAFGGEVDLPPATIAADHERLEELDGGYKLSTGGDLRIQVDGTRATVSPIGQKAVDALYFPDEMQPDVHQDMNLRSNALVAAAVRGDSTVFLEEFQDPARARRIQRFVTAWIHGLEEETGEPPIMANAFGTVPGLEQGTVMTEVKLSNMSGDARLMSFVWRDGQLVGFDQLAFSTAMLVAPVSETEFAAYHLALGRAVPITVVRKDDGSVAGLTVGPPELGRSATKRHKHEHGEGAHGHVGHGADEPGDGQGDGRGGDGDE